MTNPNHKRIAITCAVFLVALAALLAGTGCLWYSVLWAVVEAAGSYCFLLDLIE